MPKPSKRDQLVEATRAKACGHRVGPDVTALTFASHHAADTRSRRTSLTHKPGPRVKAAHEAAHASQLEFSKRESEDHEAFRIPTESRSLRDGKGAVSTESQAMKKHPYRFFSRYGDAPGTNPEEQVVAAHAACFNDAVR
jgi:hypothetical protein